jgi:23S rRNA (pseudouridine1915-N3)-methyltransferase
VKVTLLAVGGVKGPLAEVIQELEARAGHYWRFAAREVEAGPAKGRKGDPGAVMAAEGQRLLDRIPAGVVVVVLTRDGKGMGSRELAGYLEEKAVRSTSEVIFVIGGAFGLDHRVLERADLKLSLSGMTLPHELARLVLAEQLYRAGTISRNEPYHKGP